MALHELVAFGVLFRGELPVGAVIEYIFSVARFYDLVKDRRLGPDAAGFDVVKIHLIVDVAGVQASHADLAAAYRLVRVVRKAQHLVAAYERVYDDAVFVFPRAEGIILPLVRHDIDAKLRVHVH